MEGNTPGTYRDSHMAIREDAGGSAEEYAPMRISLTRLSHEQAVPGRHASSSRAFDFFSNRGGPRGRFRFLNRHNYVPGLMDSLVKDAGRLSRIDPVASEHELSYIMSSARARRNMSRERRARGT